MAYSLGLSKALLSCALFLLRSVFSFTEGGHIRPDERDGTLKVSQQKEALPL
jgi:hypothetical protein